MPGKVARGRVSVYARLARGSTPGAAAYFAPVPLPHPLARLALAAILVGAVGCGGGPALRAFDAEPLYGEAFSGFALADLATGELLAERSADRLFTPASNIKLLTLATALAWLPSDSLPALAYRYDADTLRLWATAYPELAADSAPYNERIRRAIAGWPGPVEVNLHGYVYLPRLGAGWMWDDYPYAFARERSGLPVYRNLVRAWPKVEVGDDGTAGPALTSRGELRFESRPGFVVVRGQDRASARPGLSRPENQNRYYAPARTPVGDTLSAPLYASANLAPQLLEDWIGRPVRYHNRPLPADWGTRVWRGLPRDTLLRAMMLPSDNFLAEQLLLCAGLYHADLTDPDRIRERATEDVLPVDPERLRWADASGVSHYNLATPRVLTEVLVDLAARYPLAQLRRLLPAGGASGTIADWYASPPGEEPYVYAKTGTLRHNHCLSGYLRADSGRWLAFSLMHNHYAGSARDYKEAMQRTLARIREAY